MQNISMLLKAKPILRKHHFIGEETYWFWKVLVDEFEKNKELPTAKTWYRRICADYHTDEEQEVMVGVARRLMSMDVKGPQQSLREIHNYVRFAALRAMTGQLTDGFSESELDAAEAAVFKYMTEVRKIDAGGELQSVDEGLDAWLDDMLAGDTRAVFPLPTRRLNDLTNGGLRDGTLGLGLPCASVGAPSA